MRSGFVRLQRWRRLSLLVALACVLGTDNLAQSAALAAACQDSRIASGAPPAEVAAGEPARLLPQGYLHTHGNQIVDAAGRSVRLACIGYFTVGDVPADITGMAGAGFNCLRYPWYDATLQAHLNEMDRIVAFAQRAGLKVIFDHHGNEVPSRHNGFLPYPCNGLPFDLGDGTDGSDGCGDRGTIDVQRFVADWVLVARRYANNATVVGFDLTNEPHFAPLQWRHGGGATWGDGGATDLKAIYERAADAIQSVNPGVLIICEGIGLYRGKLHDGQALLTTGVVDLSFVEGQPVTLTIPAKVVYSVHDYPQSIDDVIPGAGPVKIRAMTAAWGHLVTGNIAPVWIGEMGASLDGVGPDSQGGRLAEERAWAATLIPYLNGRCGAEGGPTFSADAQPVSTSWWAWGRLGGEAPDGTLDEKGRLRPAQLAVYSQLRPTPGPADKAAH